MESVSVSQFSTNISKYLALVKAGQTVNIIADGHTMALLSPPRLSRETAENQLAEIAKNAQIGDILTPMNEDWDALK